MRRIVWAVLTVVLLVVAAAVLYGYTHQARTVKAYYRLERRWSASPVLSPAEKVLELCEPLFLRAGLLGPARVQIDGISYDLDPHDLVPLTILRTGEWQPEVWNAIEPALSQGAVFLDVGAHIGYFSLRASPVVGKSGRVVSFEPNPQTLAILRENVSANRFDNITVEPVACTDRPQTLTLYAASRSNTGASSLSKGNAEVTGSDAGRAFTVQGRPIDDVVKELGLTRVDAIKIDVEGAEVMVLRGAVDTLRRFHPKVIAEVIPRQLAEFHASVEDVRSLLRDAGYRQSRPLNSEETDWEWTTNPPASVIRMSDPATSTQLTRGFYGLEGSSWRWTAGHFSVSIRPVEKDKPAKLVLKFVWPEASMKKLKTVTVSAKIGDLALPPKTYSSAGEQVYEAEVAPSALGGALVQIDFSLDHVIAPSPEDGRELGIVVTSVALEAK